MNDLMIDGVRVRRRALPTIPYLRALVRYLRGYGWPRRIPLAIFSRCYVFDHDQDQEEGEGRVQTWTFRGQAALADERLNAHELGHLRGLPHTVTPASPREMWRAITDTSTWTIMHPWGLFRRSDPNKLVDQWRAIEARAKLEVAA